MAEKIPTADITDQLPEEIGEIDLYQKREKIYTRKIEGFFQRVRTYTGWPLLMGYFLMPWIDWGGQQSILFDLPARKFHILGLTLWPQDFPFLAWILIICAFSLFLVTKLFGRVWCGYTCPQTVWTSMFMWVEQRTEGTRNQRIKLDKGPWTREKVIKKTLKHGMWLGLAIWTGFTFVAYFTPARQLLSDFFNFSVNPWAFSWVAIFTMMTYLNAGWLREQVCMFMCPYARFQSVMFDSNTLIVSYDTQRGEPRGSRKKNIDPKAQGLGDCVDCELCVQVCPTGIDIRKGLQIECIGCALCVDACNAIMDKMGYPRGLIDYTTENRLRHSSDQKNLFLRLDVLGYAFAISIMVGLFIHGLLTRVPLELDIIRDRGALYERVDNDFIENSYTARIVNMSDDAHTFILSLDTNASGQIIGENTIFISPGDLAELPFRIRMAPDANPSPVLAITVNIRAQQHPQLNTSTETRFLRPTDSEYER